MTTEILLQLAHTDLLSTELSAGIFSGNPPSLAELVASLLMSAGDCHFAALADATSNWHVKRSSRGLLIATYLLALGLGAENTWPTGEESSQ